jgi:hypothetical protein
MWDRPKFDKTWEYIKRQFKGWSLPHYLIDAALTLLLPYALSLVLAIALYQIIILVVLTGAAVTGVILLLMHPGPYDLKGLQDRLRVEAIERQQQALEDIGHKLTDFAKIDSFGQDLDWNWFLSASGFVSATCSAAIAAKFDEIANITKDTDACKMYLAGLALNLSLSDLRTTATSATTAT